MSTTTDNFISCKDEFLYRHKTQVKNDIYTVVSGNYVFWLNDDDEIFKYDLERKHNKKLHDLELTQNDFRSFLRISFNTDYLYLFGHKYIFMIEKPDTIKYKLKNQFFNTQIISLRKVNKEIEIFFGENGCLQNYNSSGFCLH